MVGIISILMASAIEVCLSFLVMNIRILKPNKETFSLIKTFFVGVILATRFIHILLDAYESLTNPCLGENPWHHFPFTSFVAMMAAILTLMMESFAIGYHKRNELGKAQPMNADEEIRHDFEHEGLTANMTMTLDYGIMIGRRV